MIRGSIRYSNPTEITKRKEDIMLKRIISAIVSLFFALFATAAMAQPPKQPAVKKWKPSVKRAKVKSRRAVTADGQKVLVDQKGVMYLLTKDGKRFMVDQNGNKIQVNQVGQVILMPSQKVIKIRLGPGPVA